MFGSCFIEAALLVPKDWKVLRPLQQAFYVSVQLAATVEPVHGLGSCPESTLHLTVPSGIYKPR